jgi:thiamine-monophosphate kinase
MKLKRLGEFGAIGRIARLCAPPGRDVKAGIGEDAAAFSHGAGLTLAGADMMVEGVHFDLNFTSWRDIGYKALASNLSDIAAMGGLPRYYLVSVALRGDEDERSLIELYSGFEEAAGPHGVRLIGGDTTGTPGPSVVSVTVLGEAGPKGPIRRSGARPGDLVLITGTLGDSAAGLELLRTGAVTKGHGTGKSAKEGGNRRHAKDAVYLISRHVRPEARVKVAYKLGASGLISSMIDVSDGFSSDLGHILAESGVGARVKDSGLPLSEQLVRCFGARRALGFALDGGEDYELIFTARPRSLKRLADICAGVGVGLAVAGEITKAKGAYLVAGKGSLKEIRPGGYEHFRK